MENIGIVLTCISMFIFGFLIGSIFSSSFKRLFTFLFIPQRKRIKGEILEVEENEIYIPVESQGSTNILQDRYQMPTFIPIKEYLIKILDKGTIYIVKIPKRIFNKIKKEQKKKISLLCKKHSWGNIWREKDMSFL